MGDLLDSFAVQPASGGIAGRPFDLLKEEDGLVAPVQHGVAHGAEEPDRFLPGRIEPRDELSKGFLGEAAVSDPQGRDGPVSGDELVIGNEEEAAAAQPCQACQGDPEGLRALGGEGEGLRGSRCSRAAEAHKGARRAPRRAREARRGSQLHHGLVVIPRVRRVEKVRGERPDGSLPGGPVGLDGEAGETAQDADDIAVDGGHRLREGYRRDGGGRVGADSGKPGELRGSFWESPRFGDGLGRPLEVSGAGVVAEAAPEGLNGVAGCRGQGDDIGEAIDKRSVAGKDGRHRRLLEHELGDEDPVGIDGSSPREISPVSPEPLPQGLADRERVSEPFRKGRLLPWQRRGG